MEYSASSSSSSSSSSSGGGGGGGGGVGGSSGSSPSSASPSGAAAGALVLGVPLPVQPAAWALPPSAHRNPIDPLTGLAPSPPRLPLPTLRGALELSEAACHAPPPAHVCTDALLEDALDGLLLAGATDPAPFAQLAALRSEEAAWAARLQPPCPGPAQATSLELLAHHFRCCMSAFLARQADYAALLGKACAKSPFTVDSEAYLRMELALLGRAAAHCFSQYHRALGRGGVAVTWGAMLEEFRGEVE